MDAERFIFCPTGHPDFDHGVACHCGVDSQLVYKDGIVHPNGTTLENMFYRCGDFTVVNFYYYIIIK